MRAWTAIPRGFRTRLERVLPAWWWVWLHQLREIDVDRRFTAGQTLLHAYQELAAHADPQTAFNRSECRVYSQNGEDGILLYLFSRIGATDRRFVEFGIGDGSECNTANLALTFGWRGLLLEAEPSLAERARAFYASRPTLRTSALRVEQARVEPETIDELLQRYGVEGELDLLSIDIDGNDYWVWEADERGLAARRRDRVQRVVRPEPRRHACRTGAGSIATPSTRVATTTAPRCGRSTISRGARVTCSQGATRAGRTHSSCVRMPPRGRLEPVAVEDAFFPLFERAHSSVDDQFRTIGHLELVEVA